jgi:hypothetical protein
VGVSFYDPEFVSLILTGFQGKKEGSRKCNFNSWETFLKPLVLEIVIAFLASRNGFSEQLIFTMLLENI